MKRRDFLKVASIGGAGLALNPVIKAAESMDIAGIQDNPDAPATNIADAIKVPRNKNSMPGLYPGRVVKSVDSASVIDGIPQKAVAYEMIKRSMLELTGEKSLKKAWRKFVSPKDVIGLKVNPIGGKLLSTSHAVTMSVIEQLEEAGIPRKNIVIWDRRMPQLEEAGYTKENYEGIKIRGTECADEKGSFYNSEGKLYGEENVDKDQYFYVDIEGEYDNYTIPFMVNGGKNSYFTKICTQEVDKIINLPILKNAGATVTLCMKNLGFGSISNTGRLHGPMWHKTCAYVCAFPPLRDKVVLNIVDGLIGCFDGGPSAVPQYICDYNTILIGSDPVAVDRIGHDIVIKRRIEEGRQKEDKASAYEFISLAEELKLGVGDISKIDLRSV